MIDLAGKQHIFDDGNSITVIQVKVRDGNIPWVTYHLQNGPGIPRKEVMQIDQFVDMFGHLFGVKSEDIQMPDSD